MRELANGDPRPLLIYRVAGPKSASSPKVKKLLDAALKSERFQLASRWFHCVRVDDAVLESSNAYHSLFSGKTPARLLLASRDGSKLVTFLGTDKARVSWRGISSVLKKSYRKDPTAAVKAIERLLSRFDALDSQRTELNAQLARYTKKQQPDKMKAFKKKLAKNSKDRTLLFAQKKKLEDLGLRKLATKAD